MMSPLELLVNALRSRGLHITPEDMANVLTSLGLQLSGGAKVQAEAHLGIHRTLGERG